MLESELMNLAEVSRLLGYSREFFRGALRRGDISIPFEKEGPKGQYWFRKTDVHQFINESFN